MHVENRILFATYDGSVCRNASETRSIPIETDKFIHIVMIREDGKIRTYLNNVAAGEFDDPTSCETRNDADMTIGARGSLVRFFKGKIDNVRIYNRALSEAEIGILFNE